MSYGKFFSFVIENLLNFAAGYEAEKRYLQDLTSFSVVDS